LGAVANVAAVGILLVSVLAVHVAHWFQGAERTDSRLHATTGVAPIVVLFETERAVQRTRRLKIARIITFAGIASVVVFLVSMIAVHVAVRFLASGRFRRCHDFASVGVVALAAVAVDVIVVSSRAFAEETSVRSNLEPLSARYKAKWTEAAIGRLLAVAQVASVGVFLVAVFAIFETGGLFGAPVVE
jgi:hypothetical protein